jgi:uncharacterized membrane protein HdeD (DUF308 family)
LLRGLVAIVFGILALIQPTQAWLALVVLFGVFALMDGIFTLIAGIDFNRYFGRGWAVMLEGVAGIIFGLLTLIWLQPASQVLFYLIAAWAVLTGLLEIAVAARIRFFIPGELTMILAGILSILIGILLFVYPAPGLVGLVWAIGIYAIVFGIMLAIFAFRLHGLRNKLKTNSLI